MAQYVFFYLKISFLYAILGTFVFLLGPCLRINKPVLSITEAKSESLRVCPLPPSPYTHTQSPSRRR